MLQVPSLHSLRLTFSACMLQPPLSSLFVSINESPNDICGTCIKNFQGISFNFNKFVFRVLPIFAQFPVLREDNYPPLQWGSAHSEISEDTPMACTFDQCLNHWFLIDKIFLLTEKPGHAAVLALKRAYWCTLSLQTQDIKSVFFKNSLLGFMLSGWCHHFLWLSSEARARIWFRNYCVILLVLLSTVWFLHFEGFQSIWG